MYNAGHLHRRHRVVDVLVRLLLLLRMLTTLSDGIHARAAADDGITRMTAGVRRRRHKGGLAGRSTLLRQLPLNLVGNKVHRRLDDRLVGRRRRAITAARTGTTTSTTYCR